MLCDFFHRFRGNKLVALFTQMVHGTGCFAFASFAVAVAYVSAATLSGEALNLKAYLAIFPIKRN